MRIKLFWGFLGLFTVFMLQVHASDLAMLERDYPLPAEETLFLSGTLQMSAGAELEVKVQTARGESFGWRLEAEVEANYNDSDRVFVPADSELMLRIMRLPEGMRMLVGDAQAMQRIDIDWDFRENARLGIASETQIDLELELEKVDLPLDGLVLWLRPEDLTPSGAPTGWPSALTYDYAAVEGGGAPEIVHGEGDPAGLYFAGDSHLKIAVPDQDFTAVHAYLVFVPMRDYTERNPLWNFGASGRGTVYDGPRRMLLDDFASELRSDVLADLPPASVVRASLVAAKESTVVNINNAVLRRDIANGGMSFGDTWPMGGTGRDYGEILLSSVLVYDRQLSKKELEALNVQQGEMQSTVEAVIQSIISGNASDPQSRFAAALQTLLPNARTNVQIIEGLGRSPSGGRVWFVDNLRGNDAFNGATLVPTGKKAGPLHSLNAAYSKAASGDLIYVVSTGVEYPVSARVILKSGMLSIDSNGPFTTISIGDSDKDLIIGEGIQPRANK